MTRIRYQIPETNEPLETRLEIYNLKGVLIKTLVDAGGTEVRFCKLII